MKDPFNYLARATACLYVLVGLAWATSIIGQPPPCKAVEWGAAWLFAGILAVGVWLGWAVRSEMMDS